MKLAQKKFCTGPKTMRILISVVDPDEAIEAVGGGADIVDVKDPSKGSLGAPDALLLASILRAIRYAACDNVATSVALGDDPRDKAVLELAFAAEKMAVDYAKIGSLGLDNDNVVKAYKDLKSNVRSLKLVAVAYADYRMARCLSPLEVLEVAYRSDYDVFMIDTFIKDGRSTFDHLSLAEILEIKRCAHDRGMLFALAGSLQLRHAKVVREVKPDVVGFRGAACNGDRVRGRITRDNVRLLLGAYRPDQAVNNN